MRKYTYSAVLGVLLFVVLTLVDHPAKERAITGILILAGACLAFFGFAPVYSRSVRHSLVRPEVGFEKARSGLILLGLLGIVVLAFGTCRMLCPLF